MQVQMRLDLKYSNERYTRARGWWHRRTLVQAQCGVACIPGQDATRSRRGTRTASNSRWLCLPAHAAFYLHADESTSGSMCCQPHAWVPSCGNFFLFHLTLRMYHHVQYRSDCTSLPAERAPLGT